MIEVLSVIGWIVIMATLFVEVAIVMFILALSIMAGVEAVIKRRKNNKK